MYAIFLDNYCGTMTFAKKTTLNEAKDRVSEAFNKDYRRDNFRYAYIYNQETGLTIERTKGREWSEWFQK